MTFLLGSAGGGRLGDHTPSEQSGSFRTAETKKPRVMVVDDDAAVARQLALALELEGVEAATAHDGEEALSSLAADPADLVVIELMLPRQSGLELARELRLRHPTLRIVLTGAYHLSERQLTRAGCNAIAFVPKPCEPSVVAAFVRRKICKTE